MRRLGCRRACRESRPCRDCRSGKPKSVNYSTVLTRRSPSTCRVIQVNNKFRPGSCRAVQLSPVRGCPDVSTRTAAAADGCCCCCCLLLLLRGGCCNLSAARLPQLTRHYFTAIRLPLPTPEGPRSLPLALDYQTESFLVLPFVVVLFLPTPLIKLYRTGRRCTRAGSLAAQAPFARCTGTTRSMHRRRSLAASVLTRCSGT